MARDFLLEIVTPERLFFSGRVDELIINTHNGEMEVMYHTLPMVTTIGTGLILIRQNGRQMEAFSSDGFIKIGAKVTLILQACKWPYEIDALETNSEVKRLNDKIKKAQSLSEYRAAKAQLAMQLANLKIKERF